MLNRRQKESGIAYYCPEQAKQAQSPIAPSLNNMKNIYREMNKTVFGQLKYQIEYKNI